MKLNLITDNQGARYKAKRVGRGIGSGKGKTCGSGTKGQCSRTGVAINGFEGGQMPIHRRLPKRGFNSRKTPVSIITLGQLDALVKAHPELLNQTIDKVTLANYSLIKSTKLPVKLLSNGAIHAGLILDVEYISQKAQAMLEKAGGKLAN